MLARSVRSAPPRADGARSDASVRPELLARWFDLTRRQLPQAAALHGWPIRFDHCFMRVCLDAAFGRPWHEAIARPAIRHAADHDLMRAVAVAESLLAEPALLRVRNAESLRMRRDRAGFVP